MYTDRQIASLVVCLQRPEAAEADLTLLSKKCPSIDVAAYRISPRRNQASILRHLLAVCTRDEIEKNRTSAPKNAVPKTTAPVLEASASSLQAPPHPAKSSPAKKKPSPKKKSTPASAGKTSTTATPSSQQSSTTTE